jgi:hypothetical protein
MKPRIGNLGIRSTHAVHGKKKKLIKFEEELKKAGYKGVLANKSGRKIPACEWIILYEDNTTGEIEKIYVYRANDGRFAKRPPPVVSISQMKKILKNS